MPRTSAAERSAVFYRAGQTLPRPPKELSARARVLWRSIVVSKPVDWFEPGSLVTLADHCEMQGRLMEVWRELRTIKVGDPEAKKYLNELRTLRGLLSVSGRQLRLTVQETTGRAAAKSGERQTPAAHHRLIGGAALHGNGAA